MYKLAIKANLLKQNLKFYLAKTRRGPNPQTISSLTPAWSNEKRALGHVIRIDQ